MLLSIGRRLGNSRHARSHLPAAFVLAASLWLLVAAADAQAGVYTISDCPAAGTSAVGPWSVATKPLGGKATCDAGTDDFIGWSGVSLPFSTSVFASVNTVADITIERAKLWWAVPASTLGSHMYAQVWDNSLPVYFTRAPVSFTQAPQTLDLAAGTTSLQVGAYCEFDNGSCRFGTLAVSVLALYGATLTLESATRPTATATGGDLAQPGTIAGLGEIDYDASSTASGVRSVDLLVDGSVVATNSYTAACAYDSWAACPLTETAQTLTYDTTLLSNGTHEVSLLVTDAADNTSLVDDHTVTVSNPVVASDPVTTSDSVSSATLLTSTTATSTSTSTSTTTTSAQTPATTSNVASAQTTTSKAATEACNGTCGGAPRFSLASDATSPPVAVRGWRNSALAVGGKLLTASGTPIADAVLELSQTAIDEAGQSSELQTTKTAPNGDWFFRVPVGPSRVLTVSYRAHLADRTPAATLALHETVVEPVSLVAPTNAVFGRPVLMRGQLSGSYIPPHGAIVAMQIHFNGRWRTIDLVHTDASGHFEYEYVFAGVAAGTFSFRAYVPTQAAYPFAQTQSAAVPIQAGATAASSGVGKPRRSRRTTP